MKMKTVLFTVITLFLLIGNVGCEKEKTESDTCNCENISTFIQYEDIKGIVKYDETLEKWLIIHHEPNTYDNMKLFIPCALDTEFKKNNTEVLFTGKSFHVSTPIKTPAGSEYSCMKIQNIKIVK